jgi:hypothetical protein
MQADSSAEQAFSMQEVPPTHVPKFVATQLVI